MSKYVCYWYNDTALAIINIVNTCRHCTNTIHNCQKKQIYETRIISLVFRRHTCVATLHVKCSKLVS